MTAGLGTESWTSRRMERGEGNKLGKVFVLVCLLFVCLSVGLSVISLFEVKAVYVMCIGVKHKSSLIMKNIKVETRKLVNHGSHYTMKLYQCEEGEEEVSSKMNFKNYINK